MATTHPTRKSRGQKPKKPRPDFPLFPHASRKWAKKLKGKMYYFGRWDNPEGALAEYEAVKDDILAGRDPSLIDPTSFTVRDAVNHFLTAKQRKVDSGELSWRSLNDYKLTAGRVIDHFGRAIPVSKLTPTDFAGFRAKLAETYGPVRIGTEVQRTRTIFKHAYDMELIDKPVRFGPEFRKPPKRVMRHHRRATGKKLFTPEEIHLLLDEVGLHMRAMVMLGINAAFGNSDCGHLPLDGVDLESGWIDFPRPKTAVDRRIPLWKETIEALRQSLTRRPEPKTPEAEGRFFVTVDGHPWVRDDQTTNAISKRAAAAIQRLKIHRPMMSFYWLRHTFNTVAEQAGDQVAVRAIMGHVDDSMSANYRHDISDDRLQAVTDRVHDWLFGK